MCIRTVRMQDEHRCWARPIRYDDRILLVVGEVWTFGESCLRSQQTIFIQNSRNDFSLEDEVGRSSAATAAISGAKWAA